MKRLRKYILDLDNKDITYNSIYLGAYGFTSDGKIIYNNPNMSGVILDSTYWHEGIAYTIERSHKLTPDKPSIRIRIPFSHLRIEGSDYKIILADFCLRRFGSYIDELNFELYNRSRTDKENGAFYIQKPTPEVLERNSCYITGDETTEFSINIIIMVQLPLKNNKKAAHMICDHLPHAVQSFIHEFDNEKLEEAIKLYKTQIKIREWLRNSNYCSFIANGSILPRAKATKLPEKDSIPFTSSKPDEIEIYGIKGMGIKKGVTIITGGGYSGKSTLLNAISLGVYNHVLGDGRELVISDDSAIQISAEDGRCVNNVNISPFIKWIPKGDTGHFSTLHASGSTSQAANIMEAINLGCKLLLIDEDKSATNFMIQDKIMKALIKKEPITPFKERVNQIFNDAQVSSILVIGGSSEYLSVADNVILMDEYIPINATETSKKLCADNSGEVKYLDNVNWHFQHNILLQDGFTPYPQGCSTEKLEISDMGFILIGDEQIDVRMLHNVISFEQLSAIGLMLRIIELKSSDEKRINLSEKIEELYSSIQANGFDSIYSNSFKTDKWLDLPRKYELSLVINRMKNIQFYND